MIEVKVTFNGKRELALIRIEFMEYMDPVYRYTAEFVIDRDGATGIHSRVFEMESLDGNILNMVKTAIEALDEAALEKEEVENDGTDSQDLARRQY